jgi:thiamine biosynthesis lipoprotein
MGGGAHLVVIAHDAAVAEDCLDAAARRIAELEERWSRFHPDSELCRAGRSGGRPTEVSDDTRLLVRWCITAWRRSGGRFDPTVVEALENHGYRHPFDRMVDAGLGSGPLEHAPVPAPGCAGVVVDDVAGTLMLPPGVRLDAGGLGKGLAADLASAAALEAGATGACVNLAGDVRARGEAPPAQAGPDGSPGADRWVVGVEHPLRAGQALGVIPLPEGGGAVASSSVLVRRWGEGRHHIVDPTSGSPSRSCVVAATVVASDGVWADATTKIALVEPDPQVALSLLTRLGVEAVLTLDDGSLLRTDAGAAAVWTV